VLNCGFRGRITGTRRWNRACSAYFRGTLPGLVTARRQNKSSGKTQGKANSQPESAHATLSLNARRRAASASRTPALRPRFEPLQRKLGIISGESNAYAGKVCRVRKVPHENSAPGSMKSGTNIPKNATLAGLEGA
jgi:hypothetical protein